MPDRKKRLTTPDALKTVATDISHRFHMLEESLARMDKVKIPAKQLVKDIEDIKEGFAILETVEKGDPKRDSSLAELNEKIVNIEANIATFSGDNTYTLDAAYKLIDEIKGVATELPELAEVLNIPAEVVVRPPSHLEQIIEVNEIPFSSAKVEAQPYIDKIRINASIAESNEPGNHLPLMIRGTTKSGETTLIGNGLTNASGYVSIDTGKIDISIYDKIEVVTTNNFVYDIPLANFPLHFPVPVFIPLPVAEKIREKPRDFIPIDFPDGEDLANDPDSFSFDTHQHDDGTACIKARPDISTRNFNFSQLVRGEESDLIVQDGEEATIRQREAVTAPVPVRPNNNMGANLSIVGGRIITGKIINYRQSWQPAAQGLGKLLYSLALAPREEIKIAMIDWRRSEYARRQESVRVGESLSAEIDRDTTVSDIVTGEITEEISGGSEADSSTKANNKPGWGAYLGGAIAGALIGGPIGAGLGIAAAHYIRPDTGADSDSSIDSWTNAVRNISARSVHTASDVISQRASAIRDLHATIVNASEVTEQEHVRTRTVRNQNQHHSLTIQYYQVLAHYRVVTEALSEEDVLLVPYAIDHDIFASLPTYDKFINNPKNYTITKFCLRHENALRLALPPRLRRGMDALYRLVYDSDSYEDPQVTAGRWTILSNRGLSEGIDAFLDTEHGLVPLRAMNESRTQFSSNQVALEKIRGIQLRLDFKRFYKEAFGEYANIAENFLGSMLEKYFEELKFEFADVQLNAHITRTRYIRPNFSTYTLNSRGKVTLTMGNVSDTLRLNTPTSAQLTTLLNPKATPRGADYELVEAMVNWLQHNPMTVMGTIWMTEDANERALRFDRFSYNGKSLLNIIENKPLGVDGNYVAFRLAPNLRVLPPIDLSSISRQSAVVSVPTRGVFAETYLSCNVATEKRDITREIDHTKAMPFGAPDIAPIQTGIRSGMSMPQQSSLPSPVINLQNVPTAPSSAIREAMQGLSAASPFPNLSYGAETMETVRTLADTAMKVDGEKQKEILKTITELSKIAADAAMAAMGLPPVGAASGSSGGSGQASGGAGVGNKAGASASGSGATGNQAQHRALVGSDVRQSDPANNYDHIRVIEEAEKAGQISSERARAAIENIVGATSDHTASTEQSAPAEENIKLLPEIPNLLNNALLSSSAKLVGVIYFPTRLPDADMSADVLNEHDFALLEGLKEHSYFDSFDYRIVGFADSRPDQFGNPNLNNELSYRRAMLVAQQLFPQNSNYPLYTEQGAMNERIQLVQMGVDVQAAPGNNPRARRAEIWAVPADFIGGGGEGEKEGNRVDLIKERVRERLIEQANDPRNSDNAMVKAKLAQAMLDVYDAGGDLSFVGIGLRAVRSDIDRQKASNSSIERFYQGKISLQAAFSEIDTQREIQAVLESGGSVEQTTHELTVILEALSQLMINGHRYHNSVENQIHFGRSTEGKWAELQHEIVRRMNMSAPPSIYYKAFDIEKYLELTKTRK